MIDSIAIIHKSIAFSVDSETVGIIKNAIKPEESWLIEMLKDFAKNLLPVLTGAVGSYFGIIYLNKQKKSEYFFKSLEIEISTHKEFRRDLLLVDLSLKLDYPDSAETWEAIRPAYVAMFKDKREHFQKLRSKWIGLIDDKIVNHIADLLDLIDGASKETAVLESKFPSPTMENSIEIDEFVGELYADKLSSAKEKINNQTNLVIEGIRKMMI